MRALGVRDAMLGRIIAFLSACVLATSFATTDATVRAADFGSVTCAIDKLGEVLKPDPKDSETLVHVRWLTKGQRVRVGDTVRMESGRLSILLEKFRDKETHALLFLAEDTEVELLSDDPVEIMIRRGLVRLTYVSLGEKKQTIKLVTPSGSMVLGGTTVWAEYCDPMNTASSCADKDPGASIFAVEDTTARLLFGSPARQMTLNRDSYVVLAGGVVADRGILLTSDLWLGWQAGINRYALTDAAHNEANLRAFERALHRERMRDTEMFAWAESRKPRIGEYRDVNDRGVLRLGLPAKANHTFPTPDSPGAGEVSPNGIRTARSNFRNAAPVPARPNASSGR